jgi:hypothetical protein
MPSSYSYLLEVWTPLKVVWHDRSEIEQLPETSRFDLKVTVLTVLLICCAHSSD